MITNILFKMRWPVALLLFFLSGTVLGQNCPSLSECLNTGQGVGALLGCECDVVDTEAGGFMYRVFGNDQDNNDVHTYNLYHTHRSWSADGNWILFTSTRGTGVPGIPNIYAVNSPNSNDDVQDFQIVQLTNLSDQFIIEDALNGSTEDVVVSHTENVLYYVVSNYLYREDHPNEISRWKVVKLDFGRLIADALEGSLASPGTYETVRSGEMSPASGQFRVNGGISLDHDGHNVYFGMAEIYDLGRLGQWIRRIDFSRSNSVAWGVYSPSDNNEHDDNLMLHIQANPFKSGELIFNLVGNYYPNWPEKGQPNRGTWLVQDAKGNSTTVDYLREGHSEPPRGGRDNVVHEVWMDEDHVGYLLTGMTKSHAEGGMCTGLYRIPTSATGTSYLGEHLAQVPNHGIINDKYVAASHFSTDDNNLFILEEWEFELDGYGPNGRIWKYYKESDEYLLLTNTARVADGGDGHVRLSRDNKYIVANGRSGARFITVIPVNSGSVGTCYKTPVHVLFSQDQKTGKYRKVVTDYMDAYNEFTSTSEGELIAHNRISLKTGFTVRKGAKFRAAREDIIYDPNCQSHTCIPGLTIFPPPPPISSNSSRASDEVSNPDFTVYPNPTQYEIVVRAPKALANAELTVINTEGKVIYQQNLEHFESFISVTSWKPGLYTLIIDDGKHPRTFKVLKD